MEMDLHMRSDSLGLEACSIEYTLTRVRMAGSERPYVQAATWGSLTRRSGCTHHRSISATLSVITTCLAKWDLVIAGVVPAWQMQAPSADRNLSILGIVGCMPCKVAAPTSIVTTFCWKSSQTRHSYKFHCLPSFPSLYSKIFFPERGTMGWKILEYFVKLIHRDQELHLNHKWAPSEVVLDIGGSGHDETVHGDSEVQWWGQWRVNLMKCESTNW